jgi:hypothetical protein
VRRHLAPGGRVLLGDGFWDAAPTEAALTALVAGPEDFPDLAGLVTLAVYHGYVVVHGHVSTLVEWDEYEWKYCRSIERYAREQPDDADVPQMLERIRHWRDAYLRWGRETLGFAVYLFSSSSSC